MQRHYFALTAFIALFFVFGLGAVMPAQAQSTADLDFNDIIQALGPRSGQDLLWDVLLYGIFLLGLINVVLIPDKQLFASMLNLLVMGLAIVSKLLVGTGPNAILAPTDLPVLVLNVGMFTLPLIIAGMLRPVKGKSSKAMLPAILMGIMGGAYFFMYWAVEQRGSGGALF